MQFSGNSLKRQLKNLLGRLGGDEPCVFCGDRANWKPWVDVIVTKDSSGEEVSFEPSMCSECFGSRGLDEVLYAIKTGITETNNTCRSYGCEPYYGDEDMKLIMDAAAERFREINENEGVALIDFLPQSANKQTVEGTITDAVSNVVKKAYDTNR